MKLLFLALFIALTSSTGLERVERLTSDGDCVSLIEFKVPVPCDDPLIANILTCSVDKDCGLPELKLQCTMVDTLGNFVFHNFLVLNFNCLLF